MCVNKIEVKFETDIEGAKEKTFSWWDIVRILSITERQNCKEGDVLKIEASLNGLKVYYN